MVCDMSQAIIRFHGGPLGGKSELVPFPLKSRFLHSAPPTPPVAAIQDAATGPKVAWYRLRHRPGAEMTGYAYFYEFEGWS